jgi:hypothetical protein
MTIENTLAERETRYGKFTDHAEITQNIKAAMVSSKNWKDLSKDKKEALEMIAHKIGRILNGDPEYLDSWHDIVGYAKLVENSLQPVIITVPESIKMNPEYIWTSTDGALSEEARKNGWIMFTPTKNSASPVHSKQLVQIYYQQSVTPIVAAAHNWRWDKRNSSDIICYRLAKNEADIKPFPTFVRRK